LAISGRLKSPYKPRLTEFPINTSGTSNIPVNCN
jgi:hypothetical protein